MPLLLSKAINPLSSYAVWNIQETKDELLKLVPESISNIPHNYEINRLSEWLVGRILVQTLCNLHGLSFQGMENSATGKPTLINLKAEISITHSFPMAAAMIHLETPCGIDLERPRHKMIQIRDKFINGSEKAYSDDLDKLCAIWCGKEVLYKIYSRKKLSLKDDTSITILSDNQMQGIINSPEDLSKSEHVIELENLKGYTLAYGS